VLSIVNIDGIPLVDEDRTFGIANAMRMKQIPGNHRKCTKRGTALFFLKKNGENVKVFVKRPSVTVFANMPNPVPYRGVSIGVSPFTITTDMVVTGGFDANQAGVQTEKYTYRIYDYMGNLKQTSTGTVVVTQNPDLRPMPPDMTPAEREAWGDQSSASKVWTNILKGQSFCSGSEGYWGTTYPPTETCTPITYVNNVTIAIASNKQELGNKPIDDKGNPFAGTTVWNGDGYVQMFTKNDQNSITPSLQLKFDVPEDCIYRLTINPPVYPGHKGNYISVGRNDNYPGNHFISVTINGKTKTYYQDVWYIGDKDLDKKKAAYSTALKAAYAALTASGEPTVNDQQKWIFDWYLSYANGVEHRKKWFKKNSDNVIKQLASGVLPNGWEYALKVNAPTSENTYRDIPINETYYSEVISDTTKDDTRTIVTRQEVKMSYNTSNNDGSFNEHKWESVGIKTEKRTTYKTPDGDFIDEISMYEYKNWYDYSSDTGYSSVDFLKDGSGKPLFSILDGVIQNGYFADSTWGEPYFPIKYANANPPIPEFNSTLVSSVPKFILDYRKEVPIKYGLLKGDTTWNDSAMMDNMVVTLIPYAPILGKESLGIFSYIDPSGDVTLDDAYSATQIEIYGSAQFVYSYSTGKFKFLGWKDIKKTDKPKDSPTDNALIVNIPAGIGAPKVNCIVKYSNIYWPDLEKLVDPQGASPDIEYYDFIQDALSNEEQH
jgi:hypothetical protein